MAKPDGLMGCRALRALSTAPHSIVQHSPLETYKITFSWMLTSVYQEFVAELQEQLCSVHC